MKHRVYVFRQNHGLRSGEAEMLIRRAVRAALDAEGVDRPCLISVMLTGDQGIRKINREQRDIDKATDVLSFPLNEFIPGAFDGECAEIDLRSGRLMLGDMVISLDHARAQGREYGHGFAREVSYLAVHSVLHLLGYDHLDEGEEKRRMRQREDAIMEALGL